MTRSTAVAIVATPFQVASTRSRPLVHLRDLDIAPENLRFGEPPDDDIPLLAETLFAAGQLQPLTVRPGRKKEAANMALDGRRRLLALRLLVEQTVDHDVDLRLNDIQVGSLEHLAGGFTPGRAEELAGAVRR